MSLMKSSLDLGYDSCGLDGGHDVFSVLKFCKHDIFMSCQYVTRFQFVIP